MYKRQGLRWQGSVEDSGAVPVVTEADGFSPLAAGAMECAHERAAARGDDAALGVDLLAAIVLDRQARAVEVLDRAGIDPREVLARIEDALTETGWSDRWDASGR